MSLPPPPPSPRPDARPPEAPEAPAVITTTTVTVSEVTEDASRKRRADSFDSDIEIDIFDLLERSRRCTTLVPKTSTPSVSTTPPASTATAKTQRPRQASTKPDISKLKKPKTRRKLVGRRLPRPGTDVWVEIPRRKFRIVSTAESEISQSLDPESERVGFKHETGDEAAVLRAENASLRVQLDALRPENASLRVQLDVLRPENGSLRAQLDALQAEKRVTDAWVASAASPHSSQASQQAAAEIGRLLEDKRVQARALVTLRAELEALKADRPEAERFNALWRETEALRSELGTQMSRAAQAGGERDNLRDELASEIATTARLRSEAARQQSRAKERDAEVERLFADCEASDQKQAQLSAELDSQRSEVARLEAYVAKLETNVAHALGQLAVTEDGRRKAHEENVELRQQCDAVAARAENYDTVHAAQAMEQLGRELDDVRQERDWIRTKWEHLKEANDNLHKRMKELYKPPPPTEPPPPLPPAPVRPWTPPPSIASSRPPTSSGPDPRDQELRDLRLTLARLTREVSTAHAERHYVADQLQRAEKNSKALRAEIAKGDKDLARVQRDNATLRAELADAKTAIGVQRAEIAAFGVTLNNAVDEVSQAYEARERWYYHGHGGYDVR